jgi:signal transduction histidine kinase
VLRGALEGARRVRAEEDGQGIDLTSDAAGCIVLLVDDQAIVGEAIRRMFVDEPAVAFHYCANSTDALDVARRVAPTVILLDLVMPGVNGLDLLRTFRGDPATRDIPVVVLSKKEDPLIKSEAFSAGASDYLVKLPDRIELVARARHHSRARVTELQRDAAYRELHASQQQLVARNAELLELNQKIADATRAKSEFLAHMSHEIRTPMNGVIGMATVLRRTALTDEQRDYVETILASGQSLLTIINDILDFSKVEAGKLEVESRPFVLRQPIEDVVKLLGPGAADKGIELRLSLPTDGSLPETVAGDITRLRQVLLNLVGNAIKFTRKGHVTIGVAAERADRPDALALRLAVADTGIGIPRDKLNRLFEAFSQVDSSTTREYGGTGLGLAISKRLAEAMGGGITVESEEGRGTTFHVRIIVGAAAGAPAERTAAPAAASAPAANAGAPLRLLLADDNPINRKVGVALLSGLGYTADVVVNGAEALRAVETDAYDLVFLDVEVMDGYEAARRIRAARDASGRPRLVAMTAHARPSDRERCLEAGMDDFLPKPLQVDALQALLDACAHRKAG